MSTIINAGRIAPLPKGLYDASTQYVKLDIVTYSNESYICKQACQGIAPTDGDYWQLLAGAAGGGKSIVSVTLTSSVGLVDTYTITYTDATTSTFTVTNGKDGEDGTDGTDGRGIISITKTASHGLIDTYTITYTDRTTATYQVTNGANGAAGRGIVSVTKTGTSGLVDTYTITYTDGTTSTYQVTNGEDGQDAEDDLMVAATKISVSNDYYNLSYTWYELKTRVNNGHDKIYVQLTLDNGTTLKMPFDAIDTDGFLHFSADVQEAGDSKVIHYDLLFGDDGFAILTATPLQDALVSGSNIKTINNTSLLGSGDITIPAGPQGPQGPQGNSGYSGAAGELEVVNNLTEGGATSALSAEMGKVLGEGVFEITGGGTETITPTLEQGGLNGTNGHKYPSTDSNHLKRVRTVDFVRIQGSATITINSGYMFNVFMYSSPNENSFTGKGSTWYTTYTFDNYNGYIYLIIKNDAGTNITPSGIVATVVRSVPSGMVRRIADNLTTQRTDYALSANQGVVLGGMVNGNNLTPTLEQGGMLTINGTKNNGPELYDKRIRTADMIPVNGMFALTLPVGYKMNVFFYTANDFATYTGNAGGWQGSSYSGTYNGYIMAVIAHDDATQEIEPTDTTLTFASVGLEQRVSELEEQLPNPLTYNREYYGELIKIGRNKFKESVYKTLPMFSGYTGLHQCMAVYGDYVLLFTYNTSDATQPAKAYLYRLSTATQLVALTLPNSTYKRPHCNSATFSEVFNTSDSILPLLYVSQWDNDSEKGCFVYDIKLINGTYSVDLVQTILPTNVSTATLGAGQTDWCVDPLGYIYCIGYLLNDGATIVTNNKTMVTKFILPKVSDGAVVTFGDADVLDHFDVPIFIYRQDLCFENGRIFMLSGVSSSIPAKLTVIGPDDKRVVSEVSLAYNTNEPEGIGVTDGKLLMGWRNDAKLYRLEFD